MQYQKVLQMLNYIPYLSVGLDVGADFTWMSIMLPNGTLTGKPFKIIHSDPQSRELAIAKLNYHRLKAGGFFRAKAQTLRLKVTLGAKAPSFPD